MATPAQTIQDLLTHYPTLFGRTKLRALDHMFVTNGNGFVWKDGELVSLSLRTPTDATKKPMPPTWDEVFEHANRMVSGKLNTFQLFPHAITDTERAQHIDIISMIQTLSRPVQFYTLSTGDYSAVANLPEDVKDEWLQAAAETLLYILHYRQTPRVAWYSNPKDPANTITETVQHQRSAHNHANALSLILRYEKKFGTRTAWRNVIDHPEFISPRYKGVPFWDIPRVRSAELLELSRKCHLEGGHTIYGLREAPFNLLTATEYLNYFDIQFNPADDLELIKVLHHQHWMERHEGLKRQMEDREIQHELTKALACSTPQYLDTYSIKLSPRLEHLRAQSRLFGLAQKEDDKQQMLFAFMTD